MEIKETVQVDRDRLKLIGAVLASKGVRMRAEFHKDEIRKVDLEVDGKPLVSFYYESYSMRLSAPKVEIEQKFRIKGTFLKGVIPIDVEFTDREKAEEAIKYMKEQYPESIEVELQVSEQAKQIELQADQIPF